MTPWSEAKTSSRAWPRSEAVPRGEKGALLSLPSLLSSLLSAQASRDLSHFVVQGRFRKPTWRWGFSQKGQRLSLYLGLCSPGLGLGLRGPGGAESAESAESAEPMRILRPSCFCIVRRLEFAGQTIKELIMSTFTNRQASGPGILMRPQEEKHKEKTHGLMIRAPRRRTRVRTTKGAKIFWGLFRVTGSKMLKGLYLYISSPPPRCASSATRSCQSCRSRTRNGNRGQTWVAVEGLRWDHVGIA